MLIKSHLINILIVLLYLYPPQTFSQNFELHQRFYYKIEQDNRLIGYAEEHLTPITELPNLEVQVCFKTILKNVARNKDFVKKESYLIDMTYDKMLSGDISYHDPGKNKNFELHIDFEHYKMIKRNGKEVRTISLPRNVLIENHRFFSTFIETKVSESVFGGELPLIWTDSGSFEKAIWHRLPDTTLIINGIRLYCHHFKISNKMNKPQHELWTLTNSGRLIRLYQFPSHTAWELVHIHYKNYLEYPYDISKPKPQLEELILNLPDLTPGKRVKIESKIVELTVDSMHAFPLDVGNAYAIQKYLEPIDLNQKFDEDTLYQISLTLTKTRKYLDEVLRAFTRWTKQQTEFNQVIKKQINQWDENDTAIIRRSLILFSRLCRVSGIPTQFIRGIYCISVTEAICYNWVWIEVFDGARWFPWHFFFQNEPLGDAAFIGLNPIDHQYLESFEFSKISDVTIDSYRFKTTGLFFR